MRLIENIRGRVSEPARCKENKNNRREELRQAVNILSKREHERDRIGLNCHVTHTFQIANVRTRPVGLPKAAVPAECCDPFE